MPVAHAALLLFLVSVTPLAFAQSDPRVTDAEDKYIRPILLVVPDTPKRDAADKASIEIRVSGMVNELGALDSAEFSPPEGNERCISAIKEVLPYWRFRPVVDDKLCAPVASSGVILVWFEEKNGKPSASVSVPKGSSETVSVTQNKSRAARSERSSFFMQVKNFEFQQTARV
jgi:hypothetical protein